MAEELKEEKIPVVGDNVYIKDENTYGLVTGKHGDRVYSVLRLIENGEQCAEGMYDVDNLVVK